jgi:hydrogenase nickel incorporation protein HypA/HybF
MHELSIMMEAIRMAVEAARAADAQRITAVKLRVGRLSGVVPEAMQFAWDVVRQGTIAETALLDIQSVSVASWCPACQSEFEVLDLFNECPQCHQPGGEIRRGRELEIASVEVE